MRLRSLRSSLVLALALTVSRTLPARGDEAADVPPENCATLSEPPPRPQLGSAEDKARRLFEAIRDDDPARAADFFFPREAFLHVKAMRDPGRYWERLRKRYDDDVHALHVQLALPKDATFERFELARRGGWVKVGEEGNRLPYWASRHSHLHYRANGKPKSFEVRVLITWGTTWYLIHLNEFH